MKSPWIVRYGVALALLAVAFGVRVALAPFFAGSVPYTIAPLAVLLAGWYCGTGPAVMNAVIGYAGLELLGPAPFTDPVRSLVISAALNGTIIFFIARFRTEHDRLTRAEEKLREGEAKLKSSEARIRATFENAPVGITEIDPGGRFVSVNEQMCRLTGYSREQLLSMTMRDITAPEDRDTAEDLRSRVREGKIQRVSYDKRYRRRDGSSLWGHVTASPVRDEAGRYVSSVGTIEDISERIRAEQELRHANERLMRADRQKDEFLAMLSHELRNPLMPIKHGLYIMERAPGGSDQAARARRTIERQVDQITRLVNDLLDVSRISRGKIALQRERFDVRDIVRRTLEDHRPLFALRSISLHERLPAEPVCVNGDAARLAQVLGNLLHNAEKFSREGGAVWVSLEPGDRQALLRVRDDGVGISRELLGQIFEPFTQGEQNLARTAGGLGLGLALVKGLVELHGGSVEAASEGDGKGSQFTVRLPVDTNGLAKPGLSRSAFAARARRVLVIEDDPDNAATLSEVLKLDGHEVSVCHSGTEGIAQARSFRPEVVLCDIGLPGMSGYDVARALRSDPALGGLTLVALTGYGSMDDKDRAAAAGFDHHLVKPPTHEDLERVLSEASRRCAA